MHAFKNFMDAYRLHLFWCAFANMMNKMKITFLPERRSTNRIDLRSWRRWWYWWRIMYRNSVFFFSSSFHSSVLHRFNRTCSIFFLFFFLVSSTFASFYVRSYFIHLFCSQFSIIGQMFKVRNEQVAQYKRTLRHFIHFQ